MDKFGEMAKWVDERPTWQKWALGAGAVAAVVATGGVAAYAVAQGGVIVTVGEVVVVGGPAALAMAKRC